MEYNFAGFTFVFTQDGSGNVISITTPDIGVGGLYIIRSTVITLTPAQTVAEAQATVQAFLASLGIS